jgi:hypothetical protein
MNKLTKYACILTTLAGAVACSGGKKAQGDYAIIPLPQEVVTQGSVLCKKAERKRYFYDHKECESGNGLRYYQ